MTESIFKVYQGSYLTGFGVPTIIVSADQVVSTTLYSEYFVGSSRILVESSI